MALDEPEVEQADAGDVVGVGQWLERGDRRVARPWIGGQPVDHPADLIAARVGGYNPRLLDELIYQRDGEANKWRLVKLL